MTNRPPTPEADKAGADEAGVASRRAALRALRRVHAGGAWSAPAVDAELRASTLDARDRSFAASLAYETLRWEGTLDWALARVSSRPLDRLDPEVLDVLRMGCWQLLHGRLPARAAVGTAVDVARAEIGPHVTGFVNGVLRALDRQRADLPWPDVDSDRGLGLKLGYPEWIVAGARERFGERAGAVLEAGNAAPGVTLRARQGQREALVEELRAEGFDASPGALASEAVRAPGVDPGRLAAVAEGRAVVQDEASMLVANAVLPGGAAEGAPLVLDACAGPGGKTTHLAELGARVVATDLRLHRAGLVADLAGRLGHDVLDRVGIVVADAGAPPLRSGVFDAVLLDAPCTGLGVLRRRPELRWRRDPADPERLGALQLRLLDVASGLLRPGGRLVYSVCTWTREETVEVMRRLLAVAGDRLEPVESGLSALAPPFGGASTPPELGIQLSPDVDDTDGMYIAAFRRR